MFISNYRLHLILYTSRKLYNPSLSNFFIGYTVSSTPYRLYFMGSK